MNRNAEQIRERLEWVAQERALRAREPALEARVHEVKAYQHARFEQTYADLLADRRYAAAARFFLEDLYGPHDFTERDAQFARVVPTLARLFPSSIVQTVRSLADLHALSEQFDTEMARHWEGELLDDAAYANAWRRTGRRADRMRQIDLMVEVGQALERYTANPLLRHSLRMMRGPAAAAGLGALQRFLETGFDTFKGMAGHSGGFLRTIADRERALADQLFDGGAALGGGAASIPGND